MSIRVTVKITKIYARDILTKSRTQTSLRHYFYIFIQHPLKKRYNLIFKTKIFVFVKHDLPNVLVFNPDIYKTVLKNICGILTVNVVYICCSLRETFNNISISKLFSEYTDKTSISIIIISPANKVWGVYSDPYVRPFVRSSVPISNPLLL